MEVRELLERAQDEIRTLRAQNEVLRAKADTFDMCTAMLFSQPPPQSGGVMTPDVVWEIGRTLQKFKDLEP